MAASSNELPPGGFGLGLALLRGNSLLSNERQDDPVIFDDEEWQLSTVLGTGTSSTVFAAHKTAAQSEPTRAVKVIMVELMGTSERDELRLEYELWSQLRHPHVIQMFGSVLSDARFCLLLELAGEELFAVITRMDELRERDTARWISQLLSALEHMHGLHIAHCDVKPENVLLVSGGGGGSQLATKLSDFGCARRVGVAGASAAPQGSRGYAAPEQRAGACPAASSVDLWGLGVLSYVLLSGTMPFEPANYHSACQQPLQFPGAAWSSVSAEARGFVSSLLVLSPPERPSASQARSHSWLANAPSTPLLTPCRLRAPDSPYAPSRTSRPTYIVPSCLLPAARERAEPPPSDATMRADAEAPGVLPLPLPPVRTFSSPTDTATTTPPILSVALLPIAVVAAGAGSLPGSGLQARSGSGFKRRASANDLTSLSVGGGGGVLGSAGFGLRRNQSVGSELASLVSSALGVVSPTKPKLGVVSPVSLPTRTGTGASEEGRGDETRGVHLGVISPKRLADETRDEARDAHTLTPKKARSIALVAEPS